MIWKREVVRVEGLTAGVAGLCAASGSDRPRWFIATCDGWLKTVDFDDGSTVAQVRLPFEFAEANCAELCASIDGRFVAVVPSAGLVGALYDTREGRFVTLERTDYHANISGWAMTILRHQGRDLLVYATEWNRLEVLELPSMKRLAPDATESSLDYFFGPLTASPSGQRLSSFGWYWHPVGGVRIIDLAAWLAAPNAIPPGPADPAQADWWNESVCWLDEHRVAMLGSLREAGDSYLSRQDGLAIIDVDTGATEHFVAGLSASSFACDGPRLYCLGPTTRVLDSNTARELTRLEAHTDSWHPGARVLLTCPAVRKNDAPCELHWLRGTLGDAPRPMPRGALNGPALNVVADSLEEAGVDDALIRHCREAEHGRRCWVIEGFSKE